MIGPAKLLGGLAAAWLGFALIEPACASTAGSRLSVVSHCSSDDDTQVTIEQDTSLHGGVDVSGDVGAIHAQGDGTVWVEGACSDSARLLIHVPPAFPVSLTVSGGSLVTLGALDGPIKATLSGSGDLHAAALSGGLQLKNISASDVTIGSVGGPVSIDDMGSGDVAIGRIDASILTATFWGSGDLSIGAGKIDHVVGSTFGSGDLKIGATVGDGDLKSTGSGDISIARLRGQVARSALGSGEIHIGTEGAPAEPTFHDRHGRLVDVTDGGDHVVVSDQDGFVGLICFLLVSIGLAAAVWIGWRLIPRVRARRAAASPAAADPRVAALAERLGALSGRTGRIEQFVTSQEFDLHRGFREIVD